ncbi:MAG: hypothetical protein ABFD62_18870 [Syntrophaceae bacterium]
MPEESKPKLRINQNDLYKEEVFTDMKVAAIRQLTPVKTNGEADKARKMLYFGQTQVYTHQGPIPIQFPIPDVKNLQQAIDKFPDVMEQFMDNLMKEAEEMKRQEQSRIIVPDSGIGQGPAPGKIILK